MRNRGGAAPDWGLGIIMNIIRNKTLELFILLFIFLPFYAYTQEVDIIPYLKQIEYGNKQDVKAKLPALKKQHPNDPSIMYLDALLQKNAQQSVSIYKRIEEKYPKSKYADAAVYRLFTYYYALGFYTTADSFLQKLEKEYPFSPYIELAKRKIPDKDEPVVSADSSSADTASGVPDKQKTEPLYKYIIQAGAFTVSTNAESLKKDFISAGYSSHIEDKIVGGTTFHVVYVGNFKTDSEAKNFLQVLNDKYHLNGRVVERDK